MIEVFVITPNKDDLTGIREFVPHAKQIDAPSTELTTPVLSNIMARCLTRYFYVITNVNIRMIDFDFTYTPPGELAGKVHIWDNDPSIRLFDREQLETHPNVFTDWYLDEGNAPLYNHEQKICMTVPHDIVFMSYDEVFADENYAKLLARFPRAKRIDGVKGIYNAHKAAAKLAHTNMVYIVDADAIIAEDFDFTYMPLVEHSQYVHIWKSHNPLNGLEYGNGGVKLFPTALLRNATDWSIDFTTSAFDGLIEMDQISNTMSTDQTDFDSWKSAFRECVKLSSKIIKNQVDEETEARIEAWVSKGNSQSKRGAKSGVEFGEKHKDTIEKLSKINNFKWLKVMFHKKR